MRSSRRSAASTSRTKAAADKAVAAADSDEAVLVAIATKGGGRINQHFGHATEFQVYEVSPAGIEFIGHRKVEQYCEGGWGEDATLDGVIAALEGVKTVLCAKVGDCPKDSLAAAGIEASHEHAYDWIEAGIAAWYAAAHPAADAFDCLSKTEGETRHGLQDRCFPVHRLRRLRIRMSQRRDFHQARHLCDQSDAVHGVRGSFREPAMRGGVPGADTCIPA